MHGTRLVVLMALASACTQAQWLNYIPTGTPRLPDGKPNLSAPAPRALDGHPDLSGVWIHETTSLEEWKRILGKRYDDLRKTEIPGMEVGTVHKYNFNILVDQPEGEALVRPEAAAVRQQHMAQRDVSRVCTGVPGRFPSGLVSEPIKIFQSPQVTLILYETSTNLCRQIFTDGRVLPAEFDLPAFMGYSAGHWEKDTLVVETAGFNDRTALDGSGHYHSDALHVTEHFHRRDFGTLDIEMTFDDPKTYTHPFTVKIPYNLIADNDIFEMYCDNEKDAIHLKN